MLPASCRQLQAGSLRSPDARFPLEDSLCAFFEGSGFAAQIGENFASEME